MELKYENPNAAFVPSGTTATPQYGGNISQVTWQVRGRDRQSYSFQYDHISRLTAATYADISLGGSITGNRFDEKLTYDVRGNINTLQRWGLNSNSCTWGMIDNLTYNYGASGYNPKNQLQSVTDASDLTKGFKTVANGSTYSYDNNGNMTADPNKGITSITYNHLNLPLVITVTGKGTITYTYDAAGNKQKKVTADITTAGKTITTTTTYLSGLVLESKTTVPANTPNDDYVGKLRLAGFTTQPYAADQDDIAQACETCMYYVVNRKFCDLPELKIPVKPEWSCRLWRI